MPTPRPWLSSWRPSRTCWPARLGAQTQQALRGLYEQCAMVGTFMALAQLSQKANPQPAAQQQHLRDAARANLQRVLGREPERLSLGPNGLVWQ